MTRRTSILQSFVFLLVLVLAGGCASTEKQFDEASELEASGQFPEAAEAYLDVLSRDANWPGARERLTEVGPKAIDMLVDQARTFQTSGNSVAGLTALRRATSLVDRAAPYNVILSLPSDYESLQTGLNNGAVRQLVQQGDDAAARGSYSTAVDAYDRALGGYTVGPNWRTEIQLARETALLEWAKADAADGRYKQAYERASEAASRLAPLDNALAEEAREVAADAVADGVVDLAIAPFWETESWRLNAPRIMTSDLNDALALDNNTPTSPFIALVDPIRVRRDIRSMRLDDMVLDQQSLREIGQELRVDYVVGGEGYALVRTERSRGSQVVQARTLGRNSQPASYRRVDLEVKMVGSVRYRIYDVDRRRVVRTETVTLDKTGRFDRSYFEGDFNTLDISDRERRRFDPRDHEAEEADLARDLADVLGAELARQIYDNIDALID